MTCESRLSIVSALCGQFLNPALETAVTSRVKMKTDVKVHSVRSTALVWCNYAITPLFTDRPIRSKVDHDLLV